MDRLPHQPTLRATAPGRPARTATWTLPCPALRVRPLAGCPGWTGSPCSSGWPWPWSSPSAPMRCRRPRLYALGVQAGYSWWQAAAVPVVADGPAIYGMFRIVSRSRRGAKGAGYGWLLVTCGTAASIGGNVAHAHPNLVAQAIAAAIPLAVLAMLEGLKGDAGEVTRLTARPRPGPRGRARPARPTPAGHHRPTHRPPQPSWTALARPTAPGGPRCPPGPARPTAAWWGRGCRRPTPSRGRTASPGRPAPWPRPPAAAAAAPLPSCNASAQQREHTQ